MKYMITLTNFEEYTLDLDVEDTITWEDFVNLAEVKALSPKELILDITPESILKKPQVTPENTENTDTQDVVELDQDLDLENATIQDLEDTDVTEIE